jgi:hypothetical protein
MKKFYILVFTLICTGLMAQNPLKVAGFDEQKAFTEAREKGIPEQDVHGYVNAKRLQFIAKERPEIIQKEKEQQKNNDGSDVQVGPSCYHDQLLYEY